MTKTTTAFVFVLATLGGVTANATVTFDWATVGNPGNGPDDTGFGAVSYTYSISKHEVTNAQYTEFLNAVDPTGTNSLNLYSSSMSSTGNGGINFNGGAADGSKYTTKSGRDNNPVVFVSFFDAMRFTNWLQNGQGSGSTESGVYTIGTGLNETRNPGATYFIPSENEWYKAAYHKNDGVTGNYWDYPTSSDTVPYSDNPGSLNTPDDSNVANFFQDDATANGYDDGLAVTGSPNFYNDQNYLTDVGAYSLAMSPYGTFDQGGNVFEWNEAVIMFSTEVRGLRGGDYNAFASGLLAAARGDRFPTVEMSSIGFRVATRIPEPSTLLLGVMAAAGLLISSWRR
jgi:formylglycine-generating enzyme required for sulfatase activity